jgi:hypothetical protein
MPAFTIAQLDGYQNGVQLYDSAGNIITSVLDGSARRLQVEAQAAAGGYAGQVEGRAADGASPVGNPVLIGGTDGSLAQTILTDSQGRIVVAPAGAVSFQAGFQAGYISLAATGLVPVRATTYVEQTTAGVVRSIASSSANDTAAGTGARTVKITYYDTAGAGPNTETLTLNGTTGVNTSATNICFIETIEVLTAGSGGANAGVISLYTAAAKGGSVFASIAIGDNQDFYCHHYVAAGKTCYITGLSVGHSGTVVGSGAVFTIKSQTVLVSNSIDRQISDFVRLYGQSSTITRLWGTALVVPGFARIAAYVNPEGSTAVVYRSAFDYYDQ